MHTRRYQILFMQSNKHNAKLQKKSIQCIIISSFFSTNFNFVIFKQQKATLNTKQHLFQKSPSKKNRYNLNFLHQKYVIKHILLSPTNKPNQHNTLIIKHKQIKLKKLYINIWSIQKKAVTLHSLSKGNFQAQN